MQLLPAILFTILTTKAVQAKLCICTSEYRPVCYAGVTYGNPCEARCAAANEDNLELGECPLGTQNLTKTWSG
ncbi:hypothetical protein BDV24DRAFT_131802 [Aspergillus arachidicola]|uniref:Kazal-like domain-containing protein n=1 Tax=Aspergillus arachidicola TaxID=656916 RepID=A0A5N6Y847_9EURO|nr:hypothetical protein BDV24DRAFT_131802 [Aspergillus arachidicola]